MSTKALKCKDLRSKTPEELAELLKTYRKELFELRVAKVTSRVPQKLTRLAVVRKDIARIQSVMFANARANAIKKYENAKYVPKELRPRRTHALRIALTKEQKNLKCSRVVRRQFHFPARKYAITM